MNKLTKLTVALFATTSLFATSVTFQVTESGLFDGATAITKANGSGYTALGIFGDISSWDFSSGASINSALSSHSGADFTLTPVPSIAPFPNVWQSSHDSGAPGNAANILVFAGSDLATTTAWAALTSSGFTTLASGAPAIGFSGTATTWDTVINSNGIGTSAVPEPSTYAMFAGVLALGYVMIRRRR